MRRFLSRILVPKWLQRELQSAERSKVYAEVREFLNRRRAGTASATPFDALNELVGELERSEQLRNYVANLFWEAVAAIPDGDPKKSLLRRSTPLGGIAARHAYD